MFAAASPPLLIELNVWGGLMLFFAGALAAATLVAFVSHQLTRQHLKRLRTEIKELRAELHVVAALAAGEREEEKLRALYESQLLPRRRR